MLPLQTTPLYSSRNISVTSESSQREGPHSQCHSARLREKRAHQRDQSLDWLKLAFDYSNGKPAKHSNDRYDSYRVKTETSQLKNEVSSRVQPVLPPRLPTSRVLGLKKAISARETFLAPANISSPSPLCSILLSGDKGIGTSLSPYKPTVSRASRDCASSLALKRCNSLAGTKDKQPPSTGVALLGSFSNNIFKTNKNRSFLEGKEAPDISTSLREGFEIRLAPANSQSRNSRDTEILAEKPKTSPSASFHSVNHYLKNYCQEKEKKPRADKENRAPVFQLQGSENLGKVYSRSLRDPRKRAPHPLAHLVGPSSSRLACPLQKETLWLDSILEDLKIVEAKAEVNSGLLQALRKTPST